MANGGTARVCPPPCPFIVWTGKPVYSSVYVHMLKKNVYSFINGGGYERITNGKLCPIPPLT